MSPKKSEIQTIRVEVMPPENPNAPRLGPGDAKKLLKQLVQQQVAEIMAQRDEFLFQPFFQQKKISDEIKRLQTMPEQKKWGRYYDRWGCLRCGTREVPHASLGMCGDCHAQTSQRLKAVIADPDAEEPVAQPEDVEAVALRALLPGAPEIQDSEKPVAPVEFRKSLKTLLNKKPGPSTAVEFRETLRAILNSD